MNRTIGGILLVAGTATGAGMLALPVVTGFAGFWPSALMFLVFWIFMTYTAFLILEVNLWMTKAHSNMITMAEETLGFLGKAISWIAYLFLLYALTTAYLAGGGPILNALLLDIFGVQFPKEMESLPLLILFGYFVYHGTRSVDLVNRILMLGLTISYILVVIFLSPHVKTDLLAHRDFSLLWIGSSTVATSFGFHIIIPSLTTYLRHDIPKLTKVIFIGSLIPLVVYLIWQVLVLGIVPIEGPVSISEGYTVGSNGANLVGAYLGEGALSEFLRFFLIFAIVTSFLGVSMSLCDFLADGLKIPRTLWGNLGILLLTFGPPVGFALTDPRAFLSALDYAGAFGVMLLLVLLPTLMVWRGRKHFGQNSVFTTPGGNWALVLTGIFACIIIGVEILQKLGVIKF